MTASHTSRPERREDVLDLDAARTTATRLVDEQRALEESLARLLASDDQAMPQGDLSELADHRRTAEEMALEAARLHARLDEVNQALRRLEHGEWGRCEVCSQAIEAGRLELLATTTRCVAHAAVG